MIIPIDTGIFENLNVLDFDNEGSVRNQLRQIHKAFQRAFDRFKMLSPQDGMPEHIVYTYVRDGSKFLAGTDDDFGSGGLDADEESENGHELIWITSYHHDRSQEKGETIVIFSKDFTSEGCPKLIQGLKNAFECLKEYELELEIPGKATQALAILAE